MPRTFLPAPVKGMAAGDFPPQQYAKTIDGFHFGADGSLVQDPLYEQLVAYDSLQFPFRVVRFYFVESSKRGFLITDWAANKTWAYYEDGTGWVELLNTTVPNFPILRPYSSSDDYYVYLTGATVGEFKKAALNSSNPNPQQVGISNPSNAPTATASGTGPLDGYYYFRYTYYNSTLDLESNGSPASSEVSCSSNNVELTDIEGTGQDGIDKIRIYGLGGAITEYLRIAEIDNPGAGNTTSYTVSTAESEWSGTLPTNHDAPPDGLWFVDFNPLNGYMFGLTMEGAVSPKIYWSLPWQPDYWPASNYIDVGEHILALATYRGNTYAFGEHNIYQIVGPRNGQFEARLAVPQVGLIMNPALTVSPKGIIFMTKNRNIVVFNGLSVDVLSAPVEEYLKGEEPLDGKRDYNFFVLNVAKERLFVTLAYVYEEA